jgi:hypothetical protein
VALTNESKRTLIEELWGSSDAPKAGHLYAIVDASRGPMTIPPALQAMTHNVACLYRGQALEEYGDDTAWIAEVSPTESVLDWLIDNGFGKRWSIFLRSSLELADIVRHLRKFTMVQDDEETVHFFRFYDPRTLRQYLPVFTPEQVAAFFKDVDALHCENDIRQGEFLTFTVSRGALHRNAISLLTPTPQMPSPI